MLKIPGTNNDFAVIIEEIIRVEALSSYSRIHLSSGKKIVVPKVLHWFEDMLPMEMFVRIHRSHLVNKLFVQEVNGIKVKTLLMESGEHILISRRKKAGVQAGWANIERPDA